VNGRRRGTPATAFLIGAILIAFGIEIVTGAWTNGEVLAELGAILRYDILIEHEYWRLVSAMFLHGDGTIKGTLLHLMLNLWALFQLGTLYEIMFGTRRFVWVYFATGIFASLTSMVVTGGPSVGASGAIFGLLGAFIFSVRRSPRWRHDRVARSVAKQCVFWAIINIVVTSQIPQIDNAAHIGGLVAGLILGFVLPQPAPPPPSPAREVIDVIPYDD
jgi:rhomboid protease GluP